MNSVSICTKHSSYQAYSNLVSSHIICLVCLCEQNRSSFAVELFNQAYSGVYKNSYAGTENVTTHGDILIIPFTQSQKWINKEHIDLVTHYGAPGKRHKLGPRGPYIVLLAGWQATEASRQLSITQA